MKILAKLIIVFTLISLIGSCSKDDDNDENDGVLTIATDEYNLNHGELINIRAVVAGEVYVGTIYLLSSNYSYGESTITGTGQAVELAMYFNSFYKLLPGNYTFSIGEPYAVYTFTLKLYKDLNITTMSVTALYKATSGTIQVTKSESIYVLTIDILADKYNITHADTEPTESPVATNIHITCSYKGDLKQEYLSK